jgi:DNA-binding Lrp family transcriptional regulator
VSTERAEPNPEKGPDDEIEHHMDETDRKLINRLQSQFPVEARPYAVIAAKLGLSESEVIERVSRLKKVGVIRRIGANLNPRKIGFTSTLCAAHVPDAQVDRFVEEVNRHPGVTHNYGREHHYNIWFTFIAPSSERIEEHLKDISDRTGITDILNMPATKVYKIRAEFRV